MYDVSMADIHQHLVKESPTNKLLYTSELQPQGGLQGTTWQLVPKVCPLSTQLNSCSFLQSVIEIFMLMDAAF